MAKEGQTDYRHVAKGKGLLFSASGQVFNHPFFDTTSVRKTNQIISRLQVAKVRFLLVCG